MKKQKINFQQTIRTSINAMDNSHPSGQSCRMTLRPASANTGIIFRRVDCNPVVEIAADWQHAIDCRGQVTLVQNGVEVRNVSILLATCLGLGIDNLLIDLDGPELPLCHGRASTYVFLLQAAGIQQQQTEKRRYTLDRSISGKLDQGWFKMTPAEDFRILQSDGGSRDAGHLTLIDRARFASEVCHAGQKVEPAESDLVLQRQKRSRLVLNIMGQMALLPGSFSGNCVFYDAGTSPQLLGRLPTFADSLYPVELETAGYLQNIVKQK